MRVQTAQREPLEQGTQRALCHTWQTARAGHTVQFIWFGGPYVETYVDRRKTVVALNVWDYETGAARVPYTKGALREVAREWLHTADEDLGIYLA